MKDNFPIRKKLRLEYYEHIIRYEKEYYNIKEYIQNNIVNWKHNKYF